MSKKADGLDSKIEICSIKKFIKSEFYFFRDMEATYQCRQCNYKFTPKRSGNVSGTCPYCSKEGTVEAVKNAQDYIDEVIGAISDSEQRKFNP